MNRTHDTAPRRRSAGFALSSMLQTLAVLVLVALLGAGIAWHYASAEINQARLEASTAAETLESERALHRALQDSYNDASQALAATREASNATEQQLAHALGAVHDCRLAGGVGRVLRDATGQAPHSTAAARAEGATAAADPPEPDRAADEGVSCKAIAEWGAVNVAVLQANAVRHQALIDAYEIVMAACGQESR